MFLNCFCRFPLSFFTWNFFYLLLYPRSIPPARPAPHPANQASVPFLCLRATRIGICLEHSPPNSCLRSAIHHAVAPVRSGSPHIQEPSPTAQPPFSPSYPSWSPTSWSASACSSRQWRTHISPQRSLVQRRPSRFTHAWWGYHFVSAPSSAAAALWWSRHRCGSSSQVHSFIFFNHGRSVPSSLSSFYWWSHAVE
jgi:hypothetical protein